MATENWYPISGATHDLPAGMDDWTLAAGANKNVATTVGGGRAGPATHDDATYISEATNGDDQALNIDWPGPMSAWEGVLTGNWRVAVTGASGANGFSLFAVNAAGTSGGTAIDTQSLGNTGFTNSSSIDISNGVTYKPGGSAWVAADFTEIATFMRAVRTAGADGTNLVSSIWGTISYTPASGGFAFLLQLAGLGALPLVGAMDFAHFTRFLSWRRRTHPRHTLLTPAEVRMAWDEIRAYRHPVYSWA